MLNIDIDDKSSAVLYAYDDNNDYIYFSNFITKDMYRQQGYGRKLLDKCINIAIHMGYRYMFLWVDKKSWIHDWYRRCGFKDIREYYDKEKKFIWMILCLKK